MKSSIFIIMFFLLAGIIQAEVTSANDNPGDLVYSMTKHKMVKRKKSPKEIAEEKKEKKKEETAKKKAIIEKLDKIYHERKGVKP